METGTYQNAHSDDHHEVADDDQDVPPLQLGPLYGHDVSMLTDQPLSVWSLNTPVQVFYFIQVKIPFTWFDTVYGWNRAYPGLAMVRFRQARLKHCAIVKKVFTEVTVRWKLKKNMQVIFNHRVIVYFNL